MTPEEAIKRLKEIRQFHYTSYIMESIPNEWSGSNRKVADWHKQYAEYLDGVIDCIKIMKGA